MRQTLLAGDVLAAQRWLENAGANPTSIPTDFNWHGFAEGAATNAHAAATKDDAEPWAAISIRVYERLASASKEGASFELSAMHLTSWMIRRYRASGETLVRDLKNLVNWFSANLPMPLDRAKQEASQLRALPIEQRSERLDLVRTLRGLKNRLNVFRTLDDLPAALVRIALEHLLDDCAQPVDAVAHVDEARRNLASGACRPSSGVRPQS